MRSELRRRATRAVAASLAALALVGCGAADDHPPPTGTGEEAGVPGAAAAHGLPTCGTEAGCPCERVGDAVDCKVFRTSGDYVSCSIGQRLCGPDLKWGDCTGGDQVAPQ
jgi:hypothetical protein